VLDDLALAHSIQDLNKYGNRLEKLFQKDLNEKYSIRINDQWRVCFIWDSQKGAEQVEVLDYHK